ncbi:MAG: DegT/DnrJ/EryC1/StrS aminotransferase family protein [Candidatus Aenigmatarchaeota archaeon]
MIEMNKPAIEGGRPVREKILPFAPPSIGQEEIDSVVEVLRSKWITMGKRVVELENRLQSYIGTKNVIVVDSCTAAMHLTLLANNVGPGDEVIVPSFTFTATANVVLEVGAKPVFVDIDKETYNINPEEIRKHITPKTKAIIPVHYAGQPCDMDEINKIAREHNLIVIEDAAHAIGARYKDHLIGHENDVCFSFYATKNMTTGEGGAIATQNSDVAERLRTLRLHGIDKDAWKRYAAEGSWYYEVKEAGWKYNMTDVAAAMGIEQLKKLDSFIRKRREIAEFYSKNIDQELFTLPAEARYAYHARHLYPILLNLDKLKISRNHFIEAMLKEGVQTSVHFIPLHRQPLYQKLGYGNIALPVTEDVYSRTVSLPIFTDMSVDDINDVILAVNRIARYYRK